MKRTTNPSPTSGWAALLAIFTCFSLLSNLGCSGTSTPNDGKKRVVTTVTMVTDLVRHVGGDTVEVEEIMGPGSDPHVYVAKPSDRRKRDQADLILYSGLHLEGRWVEDLEKNPKARAVTDAIPRDKLLGAGGTFDPHVWFDVSLWKHTLDVVVEELSKLHPDHADRYKSNAAAYRKELDELHEEVKRELATIPKDRRVLVTSHDAFRYFGRAYNMEVKGLQGVSTASEAGLKEVRQIVDLVTSRKIKALFPETSVSDDGLKKVIQECKDRGHEVKEADAPLFSDSMDAPGTPGGTYPGMIRENARLIVRSLK